MSPFISRRRFLVSLAAAVCALGSSRLARAGGGDLMIVLNAKNGESPDLAAAKAIFLGNTRFWKGNLAIRVFVRASEGPAGDEFFHTISVAPPRFKRLWQEKELSGQGVAPETIAAATALIAKIAADPAAIGFALASEIPAGAPGVRVIPFR